MQFNGLQQIRHNIQPYSRRQHGGDEGDEGVTSQYASANSNLESDKVSGSSEAASLRPLLDSRSTEVEGSERQPSESAAPSGSSEVASGTDSASSKSADNRKPSTVLGKLGGEYIYYPYTYNSGKKTENFEIIVLDLNNYNDGKKISPSTGFADIHFYQNNKEISEKEGTISEEPSNLIINNSWTAQNVLNQIRYEIVDNQITLTLEAKNHKCFNLEEKKEEECHTIIGEQGKGWLRFDKLNESNPPTTRSERGSGLPAGLPAGSSDKATGSSDKATGSPPAGSPPATGSSKEGESSSGSGDKSEGILEQIKSNPAIAIVGGAVLIIIILWLSGAFSSPPSSRRQRGGKRRNRRRRRKYRKN